MGEEKIMRFAYKFSNLFGTVYKQGNLLFSSDGSKLLSPVGNRVTLFDLINNVSKTLPFESLCNIQCMALTPNDELLITIDERGKGLLINLRREVRLPGYSFMGPAQVIKFDPSGKFFAVGVGRILQIFRTPPRFKEFANFKMIRKFRGHFDDITSIDWSPDSRYILTGARDSNCRLVSLVNDEAPPAILTAHRHPIVNCFFSKTNRMIYTVCASAVYVWKWKPQADVSEDEIERSEFSFQIGTWKLKHRHYASSTHLKTITSCQLLKKHDLLVIGYSTGVFSLYTMPEFSEVHSLSITQNAINSAVISPSGDWLGFASKKLGQLLVWEWQSETYILKQFGHYYDMNSACYSPNGQLVATGGDDGKVKVWNSKTGFCFVTFVDHQGPITGVTFSSKGTGHAVFSASMDGSIRAFDLIRYRNFRTFVAPQNTQFSCLALDPSGDILVAGSLDGFEIYVWAVQTAQLLDVLHGHEGPISAISFHPQKPIIASASWDSTVRIWDVFAQSQQLEVLRHESDILALCFSPNGKQLCTATMDG